MSKTRAEMLVEWRDAIGGDNLDLAAWADLRKRLVREEAEEVCEAVDHFAATRDAGPLAKELADLDYVLEGTAQRPRIDRDVAFRVVHLSNMSKFGPHGKMYERPDGKIMKGPNYREPDMSVAIGPEHGKSRTRDALELMEDTLRSLPIVTRLIVILFFAGSIGWVCLTLAYSLAGGR